MKDFGIDKGSIREFDTSKKPRGIFKGIFGFRKMFWDYLNKLNVPFYDVCCVEASESPSPVRNNDGVLESWDGTAWTPIDLGTFSATDIALDDGSVSDLAVKVGADTNNGLYGISDTQLGFAVEGVLVGGANTTGLFTDNIAEQTAAAGVTIDSVKLKDGGVSNTAGTQLATFSPITAQQSLSGAGAVNVTSYHTAFTSSGASQALTLANGTQIGQLKVISHVVDGGSGILTPTSLTGGTTITFTTVAEVAELIWTGTAWVAIRLYNTATPGTPPVLA